VDNLTGKTVRGTFCHAPNPGGLEILKDALVAIDEDGCIATVVPAGNPRHADAEREAARGGRLVRLPDASVVLPGFIDLHIHAPQYPQLGKALDVPLEVWLQRYTFPLEARYADLAFARRSYEALVGDLIAGGTTTAVYFGTIHQDATRLLADICLAKGQRAFVGKVAADNPDECPDYYRESTAAGLDNTQAFIEYVQGIPGNRGLVQPIVTPRFIPSCTDAMLEGLGTIAKACGCAVQTHCSESDWEHNYVLARHGISDTGSLDRFELLGRRTVLAHGNLLSPADMERIAARGSGVAHCPLSNVYFSNAVFPLRAALQRGVRVGLGTDIAGGPSAFLLDACRMAVAASRLLEDGVDPSLPPDARGRRDSRIDFRVALHLATAGGADVLDLPVGRFAPGSHFDAMLIDPDAPGGNVRRFADLDTDEDVIQKIVFTASRANITSVWIDGRRRAD
jgi:guanine deaminase